MEKKIDFDINKYFKSKKKVKDSLGRKISYSDAVSIDGVFYSKLKNNPPLVVFDNKTFNWELFNEKIHEKYKDHYYKSVNMIHFVNDEGQIKKYPNLAELSQILGNKITKGLIPGRDDTNTNYYFLNEAAALNLGFSLCLSSNMYVKNHFAETNKLNCVYSEYNNSKSSLKQFRSKKMAVDAGVTSASYIGTGGLKYTFGVEIETIRGHLASFMYHNLGLNLSCTRDGSLKDPDGVVRGGEYVTGVLTGDAGLKNLYKSVKAINERCLIDKRCGIHVHVGSAVFNEQFTIIAYILGLKIQEELSKVFPMSRRGNEYAGWLPNRNFEDLIKTHGLEYGVAIAYEEFFKDLANGRKLDHSVSKYRNHPGGRYTDRYSGNIPFEKLFRYKWLNFIPCNFNTRDAEVMKNSKLLNNGIPFTLEFRPHNASMNYTKIKNWVLFCMAFVSYVENFPMDVVNNKTITINDIINKVFRNKPVISKTLTDYFDLRKTTFESVSEKIETNEYEEVVVHNKKTYKEIIS